MQVTNNLKQLGLMLATNHRELSMMFGNIVKLRQSSH